MPFCLNCGKEVPSAAKFCGNCGAAVPETRPDPSSQRPSVAEPRVVVERTVVDSRPKGIRLLVTLSLVAGLVVIGFGAFLVVIAASVADEPVITDLGAVLVILGMLTFIPRYGYSVGKPWGRKTGFGAGAAYIVLGLFLMVLSDFTLFALGATSIAFGAANVYYLTKPSAKAYFSR